MHERNEQKERSLRIKDKEQSWAKALKGIRKCAKPAPKMELKLRATSDRSSNILRITTAVHESQITNALGRKCNCEQTLYVLFIF